MTSWKTTGACTLALGIFTSSTAFAEVTAEQVWNDWKNYMSAFGYELNTNESISGDTLSVSDISMSFNLPDDEGTIALNLGAMEFINKGDGTVLVSIPSLMPITFNIRPATGENVDAVVDLITTGYTMIVSGDADDMTYNYTAADMTLALGDLTVEGTAVDIGEARISIADIVGTTNMKVGDLRETQQKFDTGTVSFVFDFKDPEGNGQIKANGEYGGMNFEGEGSFPVDMNMNDIMGMLDAGFAFDGKYSFSGGNASFNFEDGSDTAQGSSKSDGGYLEVAMDKSQLHYAGGTTNLEIQVSGSEIPLPIELAIQEWAFNLLMPISKSDEEQDFALSMTLAGYTMSDLLWGLADPTTILPRDPATFAFDLAGKAKLFFDLLDEEQMLAASSGDTMPGELNSLSLNSLTVSAAGTTLTGEGSFTFDNSDLETFQGFPAPTGSIDLTLIGVNGLLDNLVTMGLMPEDQVMGMRMMMGMFAVVGDGDDTLTSKIEVTGDGQVKANGQRLK